MKPSTKIFGIGLEKTGTTTLGKCFKLIGFNHYEPDQHPRTELVRDVRMHEDYSRIREVIDQFDTFEDLPWPLIYQWLDHNYPCSKFILTVRRDSLTWLDSFKQHTMRSAPSWRYSRKLTYGYNYPQDDEKAYIDFYENHRRNVNEYFMGRDKDFLEICWKDGVGWERLCSFLDVSAPGAAFPHENKRLRKKARINRMYVANRFLRIFT